MPPSWLLRKPLPKDAPVAAIPRRFVNGVSDVLTKITVLNGYIDKPENGAWVIVCPSVQGGWRTGEADSVATPTCYADNIWSADAEEKLIALTGDNSADTWGAAPVTGQYWSSLRPADFEMGARVKSEYGIIYTDNISATPTQFESLHNAGRRRWSSQTAIGDDTGANFGFCARHRVWCDTGTPFYAFAEFARAQGALTMRARASSFGANLDGKNVRAHWCYVTKQTGSNVQYAGLVTRSNDTAYGADKSLRIYHTTAGAATDSADVSISGAGGATYALRCVSKGALAVNLTGTDFVKAPSGYVEAKTYHNTTDTNGEYRVGGTKVVTNRQALVSNANGGIAGGEDVIAATDSRCYGFFQATCQNILTTCANNKARINDILARLRSHGLISET